MIEFLLTTNWPVVFGTIYLISLILWLFLLFALADGDGGRLEMLFGRLWEITGLVVIISFVLACITTLIKWIL